MKYLIKIMTFLLLLISYMYSDVVTIDKNSYKVLTFDKMIRNIKVSNNEIAEVTFIQNPLKPLREIKVLGKDFGNVTLLITFDDHSMITKDIDIVKNIKSIVNAVHDKYPLVKVTQINDSIIVDGKVPSDIDKDKIKNMFQKIGFDTDTQFVDLTHSDTTKKMVRLKLYIAEIDNNKGQTIKNNWSVGFKNYLVAEESDGRSAALKNSYYNYETRQYSSYTPEVTDAMAGILGKAVSLTGGLTSAANYLTNNFNVGLTLNYLATQGVATILTETTLVTTEEQTAKFHAGGEILIKTQGVTAEGQPTVSYEPKEYGIILEMLASKIVNDGYIDLNINTKSTKLDWANAVDGIPSFKNQSVETKVIIKDSTTIVLGGLIDNKDSKNLTKIPVLGDIPIIGNLFRSKDFQNGNSELVFFITPEIVNPVNNTQNLDFNNMKKSMEQKHKDLEKASILDANTFKSDEKKEEAK